MLFAVLSAGILVDFEIYRTQRLSLEPFQCNVMLKFLLIEVGRSGERIAQCLGPGNREAGCSVRWHVRGKEQHERPGFRTVFLK